MKYHLTLSSKPTLCVGLSGLIGLAGLTSVQVASQSDAGAPPTTRASTQPATRSADDEDAADVADRLGGGLGSRVGDRLRGRGEGSRSEDQPREDRRRGDSEEREGERRDPSEAEWEQTVEFLAEHAPRRLEMYEHFVEWIQSREQDQATQPTREDGEPGGPEGSEGGGKGGGRDPQAMMRFVRGRIFQRVESLQRLADRDPELYTFALRQFELEDEIYGIMMDVRRARESGDEASLEEAQTRARDAMHRYARNTFAERESRIERLSEELEREQERLERDRENIDEMIRRLEKRFGDALPPDGGRRKRGDDRGDDSERDGDRGER